MPPVPVPGPRFNFAKHLIDRNAGRASKAAFIDDRGTLSYGDLAERIRRMAAALLAAGVRREERVLLLMQDCVDWPVSFLGAMYAGIVPVAVNTVLSINDYVYMLAHSRSRAVLVSAALLPTLRSALAIGDHEVKTVIVSLPAGPLDDAMVALDTLVSKHAPLAEPAGTAPDDPGFWLYSSGSTGRP